MRTRNEILDRLKEEKAELADIIIHMEEIQNEGGEVDEGLTTDEDNTRGWIHCLRWVMSN